MQDESMAKHLLNYIDNSTHMKFKKLLHKKYYQRRIGMEKR